jgi:soluble lytic murein transglycosylase-like protein
MRTLDQIILFLMAGCCLIPQAMADIYVFTGDDGSVSLSNVPSQKGYKVLIKAPEASSGRKNAGGENPLIAAYKGNYGPIIENAARSNGLDSALLHAVISVESKYNPKAVSSKGAAGLMQLMPGTAKRYGVADRFDPKQNIQGGAKYLRDLLGMFNSDLSLALAAYNAGENAVVKNGNRIPPIRETMNYVPKVLHIYHQYQTVHEEEGVKP